MGRLDSLRGERVYFDTAPIIYSVEKHDDYWFLLFPLWQFLKSREIEIAGKRTHFTRNACSACQTKQSNSHIGLRNAFDQNRSRSFSDNL